MRNNRKFRALVATGAAGLMLAGAGVAVADEFGIPELPGTAKVGTLNGSDKGPTWVTRDGVTLSTWRPTDVAVFDLPVSATEAEATWHQHPGLVIAVVKEGEVSRKIQLPNGKCKLETFKVGQAFTESHPHKVWESGDPAANTVLGIATIHSDTAPEFRIDAATPRWKVPTCR